MVLPALVLMLFYVLYPLVTLATSAFMQFPALGQPGRFVGTDNFRVLLQGSQFLAALGRSAYFTLANIVAQTLLALGIALLLNMDLPGRNIARGAVLFPFVVPAVVAAIVWDYALNDLTGVVNYILISLHLTDGPLRLLTSPRSAMNTVVLISVWKFVPLLIILFLARLQTIPIEVVEAARCDGANTWQVFRHVTLPWLAPVMIVAIMLRTILSFNEFEIPFLLAQGGPLDSVLVLPVYLRQLLFDKRDIGLAAALSLVMMGMLVIASLTYVTIYRRVESYVED